MNTNRRQTQLSINDMTRILKGLAPQDRSMEDSSVISLSKLSLAPRTDMN